MPKCLWAYRSKGAELALNYDCGSWLKVNVHGGYTLGTKLTIANQDNEHKRHLDLKGAPYFGGEIYWNL